MNICIYIPGIKFQNNLDENNMIRNNIIEWFFLILEGRDEFS